MNIFYATHRVFIDNLIKFDSGAYRRRPRVESEKQFRSERRPNTSKTSVFCAAGEWNQVLISCKTGEQFVKIKNRRKTPISKVKISPDGKKIVYVLNEIGKVKVYIQDLQTNDRQLVLKYGSRNALQETDYNYPLFAWSPNNMELGILYEKRDVIQSLFYDLTNKKKKEDILSFSIFG